MKKEIFTSEHEKSILELYKSGRQIIDISKMFGVSTYFIRQVLKKYNITLREGGWHFSDETKQKTAKRLTGAGNPFWHKKHSTVSKLQISEHSKGRKAWNIGIPCREETKEKLRQYKGELASGWLGGKCIELYGGHFTQLLREEIRIDDNNTCQRCLKNLSSPIHEKRVSIHHIDYNKLNSAKSNLISLCSSCHSRTNTDRLKWERYFKQLKNLKNKKYLHKEVLIISTRPDVIKMYPIWKKLGHAAIVINIAQQKELTQEALRIFDWHPDIDLELMEESQTLPMIISKTLSLLPAVLHVVQPKRVWVHGDTSSAYAAALTAVLAKIPLVHVEAGLRSYDMNNPFPEEMNRRQIDIMSNILLAPTHLAADNLKYEVGKYADKLIEVTGNTVVDALEIMKSKLSDSSPQTVPFVLATIHRRESFGPRMIEIFKALKELSKTIKVVLPAHPNPNVRKALEEVGLDYVEPMTYIDFLTHMKFCEFVVTDSGGVQEEAPSFQKKTIVLREVTERPEAVEAGISTLIEKFDEVYIINAIKQFAAKDVQFGVSPFGDGRAADRIVKNLKNGKYD